MDNELIQQVEDLMIKAHDNHINLDQVTFNWYYQEGKDTNQRAEILMNNLVSELQKMIDNVQNGQPPLR